LAGHGHGEHRTARVSTGAPHPVQAGAPTRENAMQSRYEQFDGWQWLAGNWSIAATHPLLPGADIAGQSTFEWLADQRFLSQRSHFDHPDIPDAITLTGIIDDKVSMHYFDPRGVHRRFEAEITADTWRYWNDTPGFSQRFTGRRSPDGHSIDGEAELSRDDGITWRRDLTITYRRTR
jgi:hypothetical protein